MDQFTRFNRKPVQDRQIDTLIGLSKGMTADGRINQAEAQVLQAWLIQAQQASGSPIIINLLQRVSEMLADDVLDEEESAELLATLRALGSAEGEVGELAKAATLPLDDPLPSVVFPGRAFLFTGTCAFGSRRQCEEATEALGGVLAKNLSRSTHYLVIGSYVSDSWVHETFGRKIEKAMQYREKGTGIAIISEEHWLREAKL